MSRLIDADKLIEIIEENNQKLEERIKDARTYIQKEVYEAQLFTAVDIVKLIKEQPTSYNVDKVVEQLEKSHFHTDATFDDDGYCNDDSEEVVNLNEAIEIIKRGGIDE